MNRYLRLLFLAAFLIILTAPAVAASDFFYKDNSILPETFINIYHIERQTSFGLKQNIWNNMYTIGNFEYRSTDTDLLFQGGAVYILPQKFVLLRINGDDVLSFNLYLLGGGGLQFSRNKGYHYPYLLLGINYLLFFSESVYPLSESGEPYYRSGFSFYF